LFAFFTALPVWAESLSLEAGSAVLMDVRSKRLLYEQDSARKIPPASLTKVMSMFIVLDAVKAGKLSLRTPGRVSRAAARVGGSKMHLKTGERVRLDDLLRGMAVASANDASAAVAEHMAGSQAAFVSMMNRKAGQIGMKNTVFKTPHGLPAKGQVTTAADMLRLACRYLEAHPAAREYHATPAMFHNGFMMQNTNKMLGQDAVSGLKTGFTRESGYNIILTSKLHGREMVGVLMRAPSSEVRTREAQRLLEYGASLQAKARSAKGKTARPAALAAAGRGKDSPLPRRVLPQTASLPPPAQGSRVR
jgi:D-alanyl-D-alanine carboxypeptidase (penicillin-binding protein 5/6)